MTAEGRQRIDKWLFFARAVKSRALAAKLVQLGRVRVDGERVEQPSHSIKPGDTLTLTMDRTILVWRVVATGTRRGPATEARTLYVDVSQSSGSDGPPSEMAPLRHAKPQPE